MLAMMNETEVNVYCVYAHYKSSDKQPFYIGKGKAKRAYSKKGRSSFWKRVTDKYDWYVSILHSNLSEQDALSKEVELIALYGRRDNGTGILVNLTDGGESTINMSEQSRQKISEKAKGRVVSDEVKKRLSLINKGRFLKNPQIKLSKPDGEKLEGRLSDIVKVLGITNANERFKLQKVIRGDVAQYDGWYLNDCFKTQDEIAENRSITPNVEYTFVSTTQIIKTTRAKFNKIVDFKISPLFNGEGKRRICKGWGVVRDGETVEDVLKHIENTGSPKYEFTNKITGEVFVGKTSEFQKHTSISKSRLTDLFRKERRVSVDGWIITEYLNETR